MLGQTSIQQGIYENTRNIGDDAKKIKETTIRIEEATRRIEAAAKRNDQSTERIDNDIERSDRTIEGTDYTTKRMNENVRNLAVRRSLKVSLRYLGIEIIPRKRQTLSSSESLNLSRTQGIELVTTTGASAGPENPSSIA